MPALTSALLPQYQSSAAFMERFLIAAHEDGAPVERSPNSKGIKLVDGSEIDSDMYDYFTLNQQALRNEFLSELKDKLSDAEVRKFCETVANDWYDGKRLRENGRCLKLKRSVFEYLKLLGNSPDALVCFDHDFSGVDPLIEPKSVAAILTVNDQMLYRHVEAWKEQRSVTAEISDNDIFFRRGLALDSPLPLDDGYKEWGFINSYSLAFSASEKFAQMSSGRIPAMVSGEATLFNERVLFFSAFVPKMEIGQLELGVIPSQQPLPIYEQGDHGGIKEYILDPAPFQKAVADDV